MKNKKTYIAFIFGVCAITTAYFIMLKMKNREEITLNTIEENIVSNNIKKTKNANCPIIDALHPTNVIVRVNGHDITKHEFAVWESAFSKMFAVTCGLNPNSVNPEINKFKMNNRMNVLQNIVKHSLIEQYANDHGISADESDVEACKKRFLELMKKQRLKFENAVLAFGKDESDAISKMLNGDALAKAVIIHTSSNDLYHVSDIEFSNRVAFVRKANADADTSNSVARAKAMQAKKEILAGADFASIASKYAELVPEQGIEWDTLYTEDLDVTDAFHQWLLQASPGDISDPIELDDSISIVKLKSKKKDPNSTVDESNAYAYEVVRCAFYLYEKYDDFDGDRKLIEDDMIALRIEKAMKDLRTMLLSTAKIEFPNGDNLFYPPKKSKKKTPKKSKTKSVK